DKKEVRARFAEKYQFDPNKLIVGYFSGDWDEDVNYKLFKFFSQVLAHDIQVYVKIRPNRNHSRQHKKWLAKLASNRHIPVIVDMNVSEFFWASDVIVTDFSGAGAEALLFDNASVLLDIYEFMQLKELSYYNDCVVVKTAQELDSFFKKIIDEPAYLASLKKEGLVNARKHFFQHSVGSSNQFIAKNIMEEI
ncbi:uncharacterized protein METZ01_LOCUS472846, partial [marine metagenome]